jgi:large subunit ribosomal protein L19
MHALIKAIEADYMKLELPKFKIGDLVRVSVRVDEGEGKFRTQMYEGTVIKKQGSGIRETFTVRRISFGEGVERTFPSHSPTVQKVEMVRGGKVRRSKLYYLRDKTGKTARIEQERKTEEAPAVAASA